MSNKSFTLNLDFPLDHLDKEMLKRRPTKEEAQEYNAKVSAWAQKKPEERGPEPLMSYEYLTSDIIFFNVVCNAFNRAYPKADRNIIYSCGSLLKKIKEASAGNKKLILNKAELSFMKRALSKAEWDNNLNTYELLRTLDEVIDNATDIEG